MSSCFLHCPATWHLGPRRPSCDLHTWSCCWTGFLVCLVCLSACFQKGRVLRAPLIGQPLILYHLCRHTAAWGLFLRVMWWSRDSQCFWVPWFRALHPQASHEAGSQETAEHLRTRGQHTYSTQAHLSLAVRPAASCSLLLGLSFLFYGIEVGYSV